MLVIDDRIYDTLARKLRSEISNKTFYRGTVEIDNEELYGELRVTLLIYTEELLDPTDSSQSAMRVVDIASVWWEFRTFQECGEVDNTFSWREFKEYLLGEFFC